MTDIEKILELFKERTKKECYSFAIEEDMPHILDNKIGGRPYIPLGEEYPLDKNGNPMVLLLQINLENIDLKNYNKEGILEIFVDRELSWPCEYKIKHFKNNLEYREDITEVENTIVQKPLKITLVKEVEHMPINDYRFVDTLSKIIEEVTGNKTNDVFEIEDFFTENDTDMYEEFLNMNILFGDFGGYADFTQTDPRPLEDAPEKTECLFKIDSNLADEIMIGDSGIIFGLISKEDIEKERYENTVVDWDCY